MSLTRWLFSSARAHVAGVLVITACVAIILYYTTSQGLIPHFVYPIGLWVVPALASLLPLGVLFTDGSEKHKLRYFIRQPWRNILVTQLFGILLLNIISLAVMELVSETGFNLAGRSFYNASAIVGFVIVMIEAVFLAVQLKVIGGMK